MIEINLLPERLQKKKKARFQQKILLVSGIGLLSPLIIIHILLGLIIIAKKVQIDNLDRNYQAVSPIKKEADSIKAEFSKYRAKVETITQLMDSRLLWAKKLNQLSDAMSPGVWLTELSLNRPKSLTLKGTTTSKKGEEMALVGKFMDSLKKNQLFFSDFKDIELESAQGRKIKDIEVMDFVISCFFKERIF
jgi:Tfp pilus assembly protein PilN